MRFLLLPPFFPLSPPYSPPLSFPLPAPFQDLMRELAAAVDSPEEAWIHLGADEAAPECWESEPMIRQYMEAKGCVIVLCSSVYSISLHTS